MHSGSRMFASPASPTATFSAYCTSSAAGVGVALGGRAGPTWVPVTAPASPPAAATSAAPPPLATSSRAMRPSAVPDAIDSQWPRSPHAHSGPFDVDGEVADLGAEVVRAAVRAAVEEEAAADARAERDEQHVAPAHRRAVGDLAERRDAGVVVDDDGAARRLRERVAQRRLADVRQVRRVAHDAVVVDEPGRAHTDRRARARRAGSTIDAPVATSASSPVCGDARRSSRSTVPSSASSDAEHLRTADVETDRVRP